MTWSGKCGSSRLVTERLTATVTGVPCACHTAPCRMAFSSTARVNIGMSPPLSACARKPLGGTRPASGCCQRTSASTPTTAPVRRETCGW